MVVMIAVVTVTVDWTAGLLCPVVKGGDMSRGAGGERKRQSTRVVVVMLSPIPAQHSSSRGGSGSGSGGGM
jgi:hypothetical protein